jgi:hypothetical protein
MHRHIVLILGLWALLVPTAPTPAGKPEKDYQKKADAMAWQFSKKAASPAASAKALPKPYEADVTVNDPWRANLGIKKSGKVLYEWQGHAETVFVVTGDVLYYTDHDQTSTGCQVVAVDLTNGKRLWKVRLKGLGPITHTRYRNQVNIGLEDVDTLRIFGRESAGGYVELVDRHKGKTVANRKYKTEEMKQEAR